MNLFDNFFDPGGPWEFISRYGHVLSGITWIGLLYFFNFVQVPAFAQLSDAARSEALRNITFRALWWFRYAALLTLLFGLSIISVYGDDMDLYFEGQHGTAILTGMLFAVTMFLNVWLVIWPNQKVVIGSAEAVAAGGQANPDAPASAKKGARASRANTFFSIPMLWYMVFSAHGGWFDEAIGETGLYWLVVVLIWAFVEASALGLVGGYDSAFNKAIFDNHRNTILYGFVLLVIMHVALWEGLLVS